MTRILLVEDETAHAMLIERAFEGHDEAVEIITTATLKEARRLLAGSTPDLVIADFLLPDGKGTELLPANREDMAFPVIVMTSYGDEQVAVDAIKAGALDYVVKSPAALTAMPRIVNRVLREWGHIIDRKRAEAETQRRNRELALLNRVIAASATGLAPEEILETACRELAVAFEVSYATATLLNPDRKTATVMADYSAENGSPTLLHTGLPVMKTPWLQHLLTYKTPLTIDDVSNDPRLSTIPNLLRERQIQSLFCLPLILEDEVVGSLELATTTPRRFSAEDVALAWSVADQIAGVLARARLHQARQLLSAAIEQTADSIIITNTDGVIMYVNPAFERITGYHHSEVIGKTPKILKSHKQDITFYKELWATISAGQVWRGRLVNKKKDGSLYTAEMAITPVRDENGKIVNYVSSQRDITHELKLEDRLRQSQKMEAVGQLAGGVAHDFNNILQAILGYTYMAKSGLEPENAAHTDLDQVIKAANRATDLVRQLLAFSRRDTRRPEYLDLNEVITNVLKMLRRVIGEHITLDVQTQKNIHTIYADQGQIEQILMNLCVNARDAMPDGGRITIETKNVVFNDEFSQPYTWTKPGDYVMLSVSDTGVGIPAEVQEHIFEPFFTTKEVGEGTGLGLATVYAITRQHEGLVNVYSEPGLGTTFHVYLPATQNSKHKTLIEDQPEKTPVPGGSETILLAEDDEPVRKFAVQILEKAGYHVLVARDGEEAIRLFEQHRKAIDLALLDAVMPKKGGRAVYEAIKASRSQLPVLFSTGYSFTIFKDHLPPEETLQIIRKPYGPDDLLRKIREMLQNNTAGQPA